MEPNNVNGLGANAPGVGSAAADHANGGGAPGSAHNGGPRNGAASTLVGGIGGADPQNNGQAGGGSQTSQQSPTESPKRSRGRPRNSGSGKPRKPAKPRRSGTPSAEPAAPAGTRFDFNGSAASVDATETSTLGGFAEKLDLHACEEFIEGLWEIPATLSGPYYEIIKLKPREITAIARPMSRMVARRPLLHRILRTYTDPLLIIGITLAILRVRVQYIRAVRAGLIPMPADPLLDLEMAERRAAHATRERVEPPPAAAPANDAAAGGAVGGEYVPPYAPPETPNVAAAGPPVHASAGTPDAQLLASALNQLQEVA